MKTKDWLLIGIGSAIGILVARQFGESWLFGSIASIIGGLFGYFSDDPRDQWKKLCVAVRASKSSLNEITPDFRRQFRLEHNLFRLVIGTILSFVAFTSFFIPLGMIMDYRGGLMVEIVICSFQASTAMLVTLIMWSVFFQLTEKTTYLSSADPLIRTALLFCFIDFVPLMEMWITMYHSGM